VAHPRGDEADQHLAGLRLVKVDLADGQGLPELLQNGGSNSHGRGWYDSRVQHERHYTLEQGAPCAPVGGKRVKTLRRAARVLHSAPARAALNRLDADDGGGWPGHAVARATIETYLAHERLAEVEIVVRDPRAAWSTSRRCATATRSISAGSSTSRRSPTGTRPRPASPAASRSRRGLGGAPAVGAGDELRPVTRSGSSASRSACIKTLVAPDVSGRGRG